MVLRQLLGACHRLHSLHTRRNLAPLTTFQLHNNSLSHSAVSPGAASRLSPLTARLHTPPPRLLTRRLSSVSASNDCAASAGTYLGDLYPASPPTHDDLAGPTGGDSSRARRATRGRMANSKYEYVKQYELDDTLLPGCWIVVRIDGKGFTKFSDLHGFEKPNDKRALDLMDECAKEVMNEFPDVRLAYGESDEYSFVLGRDTNMYGRRASKIVSLLVSCFTATYVARWSAHLPDTPLRATPMFDGRAVCYPLDRHLRDYLAWRQADTHINNQYNTCFWALVKGGKSPAEAQAVLRGTQAAFKNELLFRDFGINYAHLPDQFKKGSVVIRQKALLEVKRREDGSPVLRERSVPTVMHADIIRDDFWEAHPQLLGA
ncbi:hypothetical protein Agub_g9107 [Astrephomene gubernaculifera]|uniref:tRNA(His) guanylyltransferase n=1 Tax=Astrephomene gubernaculifera TaxID=47775 RepID=A0AAD3HNT7_9CHLO|nr:hypothetical protein Agub_g9107 [Astrephomene gubernaculifera]